MFLSVRPVGLFSRFLRREPQPQRDATRRVVCICRRILLAAPDCVRACCAGEGGRPGLFGNSRRLQRKFPCMSAGLREGRGRNRTTADGIADLRRV